MPEENNNPKDKNRGSPLLEQLVQEAALQPDLKTYLDRQQAGDAELLALKEKDHIAYDHAEGGWNFFRGHWWERDRVAAINNVVTDQLASTYMHAAGDALQAGNKDDGKAYSDRGRALQRRRYINDVLALAQSQEALRLTGDEWDCEPMLFPVNNGVIELKTGAFRSGQPRDLLRAHSPVDWMGLTYPAPKWERFLLDVLQDNIELVNFMQRFLGYCLTGKATEHRLPILCGEDGRNGKTTLLETLAFVFGPDLSHTTQADVLMDFKRDGSNAQPFVYALRGRRLVWATESKEGQRMNLSLIKHLTGGDSITTRTLNSRPVTFKPSHKVLLLTNHKPRVGDDSATWDRLLLIEFNRRFVDHPTADHERLRDAEMGSKLQAEAPGILAWLMRGCLAWQEQGLNPPACVLAATESYREEEDVIGNFVSDCLVVGPGMTATAKEIYARYVEWARAGGTEPMKMQSLGRKLHKRFGEPSRNMTGRFYNGVGIGLSENGT